MGLVARKSKSIIRKYHNNTPKTKPWCHEGKPQNINSNKTPGGQLKQKKQLSLPLQDDCKTRKDSK